MSFARKQQFPLQSEAAIRSCSSKQMFSLVLQNSQENICVGVSFLIKIFSLRNFKNIFFTDHLLATAPVEACIDSVNSKSVFIVSLFRILEQLTTYFFKKLCYRSLTGSLIPLCFFYHIPIASLNRYGIFRGFLSVIREAENVSKSNL